MKYTAAFILIGLFIYCTACGQHSTTQDISKEPGSPAMVPDSVSLQLKKQKEELAKKMSTAQINYFIIKAPEEKFGYTIFIDGQLYIEQKSIPAIQGIKGFSTKEDAEKIAKLAIEKIKQGELPPTISIEELKENGVISRQ